LHRSLIAKFSLKIAENFAVFFCKFLQILSNFAEFVLNFGQILAKFFRDFSKMQHFLKIGGKRYGEVRNFKKVRKFASSNLKFRSSKFKFTEILICNPGMAEAIKELAAEAGVPEGNVLTNF
jgi:hypothetical protein